MIPGEDNIRKTSVFVLMLRAYVYGYALVKTSLMLAIMLMPAYACAFVASEKNSLTSQFL